jgi:hypothetical protein
VTEQTQRPAQARQPTIARIGTRELARAIQLLDAAILVGIHVQLIILNMEWELAQGQVDALRISLLAQVTIPILVKARMILMVEAVLGLMICRAAQDLMSQPATLIPCQAVRSTLLPAPDLHLHRHAMLTQDAHQQLIWIALCFLMQAVMELFVPPNPNVAMNQEQDHAQVIISITVPDLRLITVPEIIRVIHVMGIISPGTAQEVMELPAKEQRCVQI